jgi:hypothetical protein
MHLEAPGRRPAGTQRPPQESKGTGGVFALKYAATIAFHKTRGMSNYFRRRSRRDSHQVCSLGTEHCEHKRGNAQLATPHSQNTPTEPLQKQRLGNISIVVHVYTCTGGERGAERVRQTRKTKKAECRQDRERESQRNKENGRDRETKAQVCNTHWHAGYVSHLRKYISVWVGIHKS